MKSDVRKHILEAQLHLREASAHLNLVCEESDSPSEALRVLDAWGLIVQGLIELEAIERGR